MSDLLKSLGLLFVALALIALCLFTVVAEIAKGVTWIKWAFS